MGVIITKLVLISGSVFQLDAVSGGTVTAVVVNHDDGLHPATIIMDRYDRMSYEHAAAFHRFVLNYFLYFIRILR